VIEDIDELKTLNWQIKSVASLKLLAGEVLASEENVGARSDLLRLEVLYKFGGIYLDTDSHSLSGFTPFFQKSFVSYIFDPWSLYYVL